MRKVGHRRTDRLPTFADQGEFPKHIETQWGPAEKTQSWATTLIKLFLFLAGSFVVIALGGVLGALIGGSSAAPIGAGIAFLVMIVVGILKL